MSKMIQIRHVPDALHRRLKARAAQAGMSLSDFLRSELETLASRPTTEQWLRRLHELEPVRMDEPAEVTIRKVRGPL